LQIDDLRQRGEKWEVIRMVINDKRDEDDQLSVSRLKTLYKEYADEINLFRALTESHSNQRLPEPKNP
jgi:hypothetical protein